ncbi:translation initiation factor IF-2-like [Lolium rigidum]|uniref:translation initiation factor IF-2-like n=1 Tax=Lolium rigidum TaxID=89674 RepID=UPI001F5D5DD4|nr:translation initiation factor IF-2-like [Lolium rigidum]
MLACLEGLKTIHLHYCERAVLESDCLRVVQTLTSDERNISQFWSIILDAKGLLWAFDHISVRKVARESKLPKFTPRFQTLAMATGAAAKTPTKLSTLPATARTPAKHPAPSAPKTPSVSRARPAQASENSDPNILASPPPPPSKPAARAKTPSRSVSRARPSQASENSDPNALASPPPPPSRAPTTATATASVRRRRRTLAPVPPPPAPQRRFLVAKKGAHRRRHNNNNTGDAGAFDFDKCREAAREALRASQEEFFLKERQASATADDQPKKEEEEGAAQEEAHAAAVEEAEEGDAAGLEGSSKVRAIRSRVMAKALTSVPDSGSGRVRHLVDAFESLLSISGATADTERAGEEAWALPGLQPWKEGADAVFSSADFLDLGPTRLCSSLDGKSNRSSWDSQATTGGRRSRRNSSESLRSSWNRKLKVTSQHPFKLRTEQRGMAKKQQFIQKVQEMLVEDEKKRIHIAQGLPWTTDEPECLIKPPVKERTEPVDLVLHSDVRAVERAGFDQYVSERTKYAEQLRLEREQQEKLEEEEMIRQLRKELVPKAQPMPYFDRPFVPKRSTKGITIPKEPNFHLRPERLSCYYRQRCMVNGKLKTSAHQRHEHQPHLRSTEEHQHA